MNKFFKGLFRSLGLGIVTGAADDDPSGIATYAQTGAQFGYAQLWTAPFSFPFMTAVQEMCGRIGMVTGRGLAGVIKHNYPKPVLFFAVSLLVLTNVINVGANLGAMAFSAQLIFDLPFYIYLLGFTFLTIILLILLRYKTYSRILKYFAFTLFAYVIAVFVVKQDWNKILLSTLIPTIQFNREYLLNIVAILGTTISPYLFFWQASEEVEEEVIEHKLKSFDQGTPKIDAQDIKAMGTHTVIGMLFSNLIMFFIIATTASTLFANGIHNIDSAAQAAEALRPFGGSFAFFLFAGGIIGTGFLSVPILAGSASYAISETFGWKAGLSKRFTTAPYFYILIIFAILIGVLVNFIPIPSFKLLYYTAVLNGFSSPLLLILILLITNQKKIMGHRTNSVLSNTLGIIITGVMLMCGLGLLATLSGIF